MVKKKPSSSTSKLEKVGNGITTKRFFCVEGVQLPPHIAARNYNQTILPDTPSLAAEISAAVLDGHGIPVVASDNTLLARIESLGYKPHASRLWYAGAIVHFYNLLSTAIEGTDTREAVFLSFKIGQLYAEADLKRVWERDAISGRKSRDGGAKGGGTPKRENEIKTITAFIVTKLKKKGSLTALELWNAIPCDDFTGPKIGGRKIYRNHMGTKLHTIEKGEDRNWIEYCQPITYSTFRRYVTKARTVIPR